MTDNEYQARCLALLYDLLKQNGFTQQQMAQIAFPDRKGDIKSYFSRAKSLLAKDLKTDYFQGKINTRSRIIDKLCKHELFEAVADTWQRPELHELEAQNSAAPAIVQPYFLLNEYYTNSKQEIKIAKIKLFYTQTEPFVYEYQRFEIDIPYTDNLLYSGKVERIGSDVLKWLIRAPQHDSVTYMNVGEDFFQLGVLPDRYYYGAYSGRIFNSNVLSAAFVCCLAGDETDEIPAHIQQYLLGKRIETPRSVSKDKAIAPIDAANILPFLDKPLPHYLVGNFETYTLDASRKAIIKGLLTIAENADVVLLSDKRTSLGIVRRCVNDKDLVFKISLHFKTTERSFARTLWLKPQTNRKGELLTLKGVNSGLGGLTDPFSSRMRFYPLSDADAMAFAPTFFPLPSTTNDATLQTEYNNDLLHLHTERPDLFAFLLANDGDAYSVPMAFLKELEGVVVI